MSPQEVREWLEGVRDAQLRLRANVAMMEAAGVGPSMAPKSRSGTSDPVPRVAMLAEECDMLRAQVREGEELCHGVRLALGVPGNVLEMRYLRAMTWPQVADALRVSERHAHRMDEQAREWVSLVGLARARAGRGVAEG